jgi:uncharacterized membrane protein
MRIGSHLLWLAGSAILGGRYCSAQPVFEWLPKPAQVQFMSAMDVSEDGLTVVGLGYGSANAAWAFRWSSASGLELATVPPGAQWVRAFSISNPGTVTVGEVWWTNGSYEAFRWQAATGDIELLGTPPGRLDSSGRAVAADGNTIVGFTRNPMRAIRWTTANGWHLIPEEGDIVMEYAQCVSADGSVIGGSAYSISQNARVPCIWTEADGIRLLTPFGGAIFWGSVTALYGNDRRAFGNTNRGGFRWSEETGLVALNNASWSAYGISEDGARIVGANETGSTLWDEENGARFIDALLSDTYCAPLDGLTVEAVAISANGRKLAGYGQGGVPYGVRAWVLSLPEPGPGDLNGDGDCDLADLARLLTNFGTPDGATPEKGDIDGDGDVDLADLTLLLAAFGVGCA